MINSCSISFCDFFQLKMGGRFCYKLVTNKFTMFLLVFFLLVYILGLGDAFRHLGTAALLKPKSMMAGVLGKDPEDDLAAGLGRVLHE